MLRAFPFSLASRWFPALTTFFVWTMAAVVAAYWVLQSVGGSAPASTAPSVVRLSLVEPVLSDVQKALGAAPADAADIANVEDASTRFVLSGVVASGSGQGSALIAVDGQPPKAFKVGQTVVDGVVLKSLSARQARMAATLQGPVTATLMMPPLPSTDKP
jgi:general secretion pathway protein C